MKNIIPYGKHYIDDEDVEAVVDVLKNRNLTQGTAVNDFEEAVAEFVGAKYAVAMSSWTAGLHMACLAAGVGEGDTVITSPLTFVASANAALYCGAKVDLVDIDESTSNVSIDSLRKKLIQAKETDTLPKIVIPVHLAGLSCDMQEIKKLNSL